jgi:hypothetical protein
MIPNNQNLVRDLRNIVDAKVGADETMVVASMIQAFATIISDFAEDEQRDGAAEDAVLLREASEDLYRLAKKFSQ